MADVTTSNVGVLKAFFPNLTMAELKALSTEERQQLADMIRASQAPK